MANHSPIRRSHIHPTSTLLWISCDGSFDEIDIDAVAQEVDLHELSKDKGSGGSDDDYASCVGPSKAKKGSVNPRFDSEKAAPDLPVVEPSGNANELNRRIEDLVQQEQWLLQEIKAARTPSNAMAELQSCVYL